jgi:hypothetical protein
MTKKKSKVFITNMATLYQGATFAEVPNQKDNGTSSLLSQGAYCTADKFCTKPFVKKRMELQFSDPEIGF